MILFLKIAFSLILIISIIYELVQLIFLKKERVSLIVRIGSNVSILFGFYLWLWNGFTLDYGTEEEKAKSFAELLFNLGKVNIIAGAGFLIFLYIRNLVRIVRKPKHNQS